MSKAFKCDRCRNYAEPTPLMRVTITELDTTPQRTRDWELCANCLGVIHNTLDVYAIDHDRPGTTNV